MNNPEGGDIIFLKYGTFKNNPGKFLIDTKHMFLITTDVTDGIDTGYLVSPISSNLRQVRDSRPLNIPISKTDESGLSKDSYVNVSWYGLISEDDVHKVVGSVSEDELDRVQIALDRYNTELELEDYHYED